jgi:biotin transport system ATP-binding protein
MMRLRDVTLARDGNPVFREISLELTEARIGLIGSNGCGKSSMLRLLKGLLRPDAGSVETGGSCGLVFQNPDHQILFPTVMEELCFGMLEQGIDLSLAQSKAGELLAAHGLVAMQSRATHELSDGQKQLLCLMSVLADGADILLLDEPCASLDRATTRQVMSMISGLPQQVLMASHHLELLEDFDRVIWMASGRVRMDDLPGPVLAAYRAHC